MIRYPEKQHVEINGTTIYLRWDCPSVMLRGISIYINGYSTFTSTSQIHSLFLDLFNFLVIRANCKSICITLNGKLEWGKLSIFQKYCQVMMGYHVSFDVSRLDQSMVSPHPFTDYRVWHWFEELYFPIAPYATVDRRWAPKCQTSSAPLPLLLPAPESYDLRTRL